MTPFDELTLAEVDELVTICLDGVTIADADPIKLAGGVMFMTQRKTDPTLEWETFRRTTRMYDINAFSDLMNEGSDENPTVGVGN